MPVILKGALQQLSKSWARAAVSWPARQLSSNQRSKTMICEILWNYSARKKITMTTTTTTSVLWDCHHNANGRRGLGLFWFSLVLLLSLVNSEAGWSSEGTLPRGQQIATIQTQQGGGLLPFPEGKNYHQTSRSVSPWQPLSSLSSLSCPACPSPPRAVVSQLQTL
jgi:hypothetical protein